MSSDTKSQFQSNFDEFDTPNLRSQAPANPIVGSVRVGLTALALLSGIVIVGTSAQTLAAFSDTHLGDNFFLPLWPTDFDLRPTTALVACGAVIIVTSAISLATSMVPVIRSKARIHTSISYLAPTVALIAGIVGVSLHYAVNTSSTTSSIHSWSCQWSAISMNVQPHWGTLCKESKVALYLMVMMIPLETLVLSTTAFGAFSGKKEVIAHERKGSPALS